MVLARIETSANRIGRALSNRGTAGFASFVIGGALGAGMADEIVPMLTGGRLQQDFGAVLVGLAILFLGIPLLAATADMSGYAGLAGPAAVLMIGGLGFGVLVTAGTGNMPSFGRFRDNSGGTGTVTPDDVDEEVHPDDRFRRPKYDQHHETPTAADEADVDEVEPEPSPQRYRRAGGVDSGNFR